MRESEIQTKIKTKLENQGWLVIKLMSTSFNGIPDLMALKEGAAMFVEVKRPGNNPTPLQLYRHDKLRQYGFKVIVATSPNDV